MKPLIVCAAPRLHVYVSVLKHSKWYFIIVVVVVGVVVVRLLTSINRWSKERFSWCDAVACLKIFGLGDRSAHTNSEAIAKTGSEHQAYPAVNIQWKIEIIHNLYVRFQWNGEDFTANTNSHTLSSLPLSLAHIHIFNVKRTDEVQNSFVIMFTSFVI